jgi:hypothetical protein
VNVSVWLTSTEVAADEGGRYLSYSALEPVNRERIDCRCRNAKRPAYADSLDAPILDGVADGLVVDAQDGCELFDGEITGCLLYHDTSPPVLPTALRARCRASRSGGLPLPETLPPARRDSESLEDIVCRLGAMLEQLGGHARRGIAAGARESWLPIARGVLEPALARQHDGAPERMMCPVAVAVLCVERGVMLVLLRLDLHTAPSAEEIVEARTAQRDVDLGCEFGVEVLAAAVERAASLLRQSGFDQVLGDFAGRLSWAS